MSKAYANQQDKQETKMNENWKEITRIRCQSQSMKKSAVILVED